MRSIKTKITIFLVLILMLMFIIQTVLNYMFAESFYVDRRSSHIEAVYQELRNQPFSSVKQLINNIGNSEGISFGTIMAADSNYRCIYNSHQSYKNQKVKVDPEKNAYNFRANSELFLEDAEAVRIRRDKNSDVVQLCGILRRTNGKPYYIVINSKVASIREDMNSTNAMILRINLAALALGAVGAYFISRKIAKPIEEIEQIALNVSEFDFTQRASEDLSKDELGRLAHNINLMADNLQESIEELEANNRSLEEDNQHMSKIDNMRKEFIANVSHELKTPITVLSGYTEMLKSEIEGIDQDYYYDVILEECEKMRLLVQELLEVSSMENGLSRISMEPASLAELVRQEVANKEMLYQQNQITLVTDYHSNCLVLIDKKYIERALNNYMINALNHTQPGHRIIITIREEEDYGVVEVYNEGKHIDKNSFKCIWDSFYRSDESRADQTGKSIGLGLYIVKSIINAHGGKYGVKNVKDGVLFYLKVRKIGDG